MNLSLRQMRAFAALAATRNFTRAADQCNLTQSAFSALISNLEAGMGLRLFSRNTRNVELTSEGEAFLNIVETLLHETERALEEMRDQAVLRRGKVAIAALPTIYSSILPSMIARFHARHPGIELLIEDAAAPPCPCTATSAPGRWTGSPPMPAAATTCRARPRKTWPGKWRRTCAKASGRSR